MSKNLKSDKRRIRKFLTGKLALLIVFIMTAAAMLAGCGKTASEYASAQTIVSSETTAETTAKQTSDDTDETSAAQTTTAPPETTASGITQDGQYTSKDDVAAYIHEYGCLPSNYITKDEAEALGWVSTKGNLDEVAPGCAIGGDKFGNREGLLPKASGRQYYECDVNYSGGYRSSERIIYSNDGLVYYTADHYQSFELLYGEE